MRDNSSKDLDPRLVQLVIEARVTAEEIFQDLLSRGRAKDIIALGGAKWLKEHGWSDDSAT